MARNFSPRKRRNNSFLPPQQRIISQFFTPRSGITKEEVNFLVKPVKEPKFQRNPASLTGTGAANESEGSGSCLNRMTSLPRTSGFTTAAKIHEQSVKWCSSNQKQHLLSFQSDLRSPGCNLPVLPHSPWDSPSKGCAAKNSFSEDSAYSSGEVKQTHVFAPARVCFAKTSSLSSSPTLSTSDPSTTSFVRTSSSKVTRKVKRIRRPQTKGLKSQKDHKQSTITCISLDSEHGGMSSDDDCCIVSVISNRSRNPISDSKVEEMQTSCSHTSCSDSSSQSSQRSLKEESTCSNGSQRSCTSEYDGRSSAFTSRKSSISIKSTRQNKQQSSANSSMYGLVGDNVSVSDNDSEDFNYCGTEFCHLPVEIMENIFCQLPIVDLMLNCVLVCRQWNSIISRDLFIPWKKKYFLLKSRDVKSEDEMIVLLEQKGLLELDLFPLNLASFMKDFKRKGHLSLLENLKTHCKFPLIETFLETFTENSKVDPSPWSVVALLTLVCQTVYEVQEIVRCMTRSSSCLVQDILECFYCLASVFYYLESQHRIGSGLHYRIFYTLYLYENAFEATCASINSVFGQNFTGQQSMMRYRSCTDKLQLTHEQVRIIKHDVKSGEIIKIVAFAGTGKTTTLVEYTKMRPMEKFLNVAYNKSIQEHALKTFPRNVESRTIHSLAFRGAGFRYKHKLSYSLRISTIMNALPPKSGYLHARRVEDTLKNFIASADTVVKASHVPPVSRSVRDISPSEGSQIFGDNGADVNYLNSDKYVQKVVSHAEELWERMKDRGDKDFPITHDGYLKIYQLSRPVLSGFDCLLIDEAQDCTPAASDILLRQRCAKILVGDPHQQIYAFRGARNALQDVQSTHTFYLTQSFRFGPEIAYVASCVLDVLKGVRNKTLVGGARKGSVLGDSSGQLCVITRCNYTLFNETVNVCCAPNNTKVGFVGGIKSLALDRVSDIHKLFLSGTNRSDLGITDPLIKKFGSFSELKKYAKVAPDPELLGKIKIVETHHVMLQRRIEKIKSKAVGNLQQADIVFSTAHKAKGLEFDTVRVTDDFLPGAELGMTIQDHAEDEKNLVYVAVTRAKKCLQLNGTILGILESRKEHFTKAVSPKDFSQPEVCADCKGEVHFSPAPHLAIHKEHITLGGNQRLAGGIMCPACALSKVPHLGCLACVNSDMSSCPILKDSTHNER